MRFTPSLLRRRFALVLGLAAAASLVLSLTAGATIPVVKIAKDTFLNATSQHQTVVEPDSFFIGSTGVAAAQAGRFFDGGASDIVFARTITNGSSWTTGNLPGITTFSSPPGPFARVQAFTGSWFGLLILFGWSVALFYHLANGIRHLFWDAGYGFDLKTAYNSGWAVVGGSMVATVAAWLLAYTVR